ncbi:hypothetical protein [Nocardioides pacificus]
MRGGVVVAGGVLGFALSWLWIAIVLFGGFASSYGSEGDSFTGSWVFGVLVGAAALAPLVLAVVLLVRPRTRQAGAGLVMGLAIGMVVGSGICASALVPGL